jgi:hypothetical protein
VRRQHSEKVGRLSRRLLFVNLLCMAALAAIIVLQAFPSSEAVRLRNAVLIEPSTPSDFSWSPEQIPAGFLLDATIEPEFADIVRKIGVDRIADDKGKALALAGHLTENSHIERPIQSDLATTYRGIRDGAGYCSDFTAVYLGLAKAAGLFAREWGFSFDHFGGHGHAVIEVFDRQRGKWMLIDVFNNFYPVYAESSQALSVDEFRAFLNAQGPAVRFVKAGPGRAGMKYEDKLLAYYRRGVDQWYLWWGNGIFTYNAHPLVSALGHVSRSLEQLGGIAAGVHPHIRIIQTPTNEPMIARMMNLGKLVRGIAVAEIALALVAVGQLLWIRRIKRQSRNGVDGG